MVVETWVDINKCATEIMDFDLNVTTICIQADLQWLHQMQQ